MVLQHPWPKWGYVENDQFGLDVILFTIGESSCTPYTNIFYLLHRSKQGEYDEK